MKPRDPLHWVPVGYKLALMNVSVCLLAFGVGGHLVSSTAKDALRSEILPRLEFQAHAYSGALEGRLQTFARRADDFASDGYIRDHTEAILAGPTAEQLEVLQAELREHLLVNKLPLEAAFLDLRIIGPDGSDLLGPLGVTWNVSQVSRPAFTPGERWYSGLLRTRNMPGPPHFAIATPLTSRTSGANLGHLLTGIHPAVWIISAMTSAGILTHEDQDEVGLQLLDRTGHRLVIDPLLISADGPRASSEPVDSGFGLRLLSDQETANEETTVLPRDREVFTRKFPIATNGWTVQVDLQTHSAEAAVGGLESRFMGFAILLTAIAGALLFFPLRFLAAPLLRLADATRRLKDGDFKVRLEVDSTDEIGKLAQSFNTMAEAIEERTLSLEETARELGSERDRLQTVITSMHDGIIVLDASGSPILHNRAAQPVFEQLVSLAPELRSHHICERHNKASSNCATCLASAKPRSCVLEIGGGVFEIHSTPLPRDSTGKAGHVLVCRDLTDRIAQDERQIHQERLAVLGEVAAVMAHELNNPLAAISMYNQMTATALEPGTDLAENTEVIQRNVQTCKRAIRELLDYATDATPEIVEIDVKSVLEDVSAFLRPLRERSSIDLVMELPDADSSVTGDEVQVRQIFVNLVVNAIQAMGHAGGTIRIRAEVDGGHMLIDISDDGPGVSREVREEIFRPFFTTKARGEGTGLGLPTARRLAEMHGGGLELLKSDSSGTTFRVRLRVTQEPHA